MTADEPRICPKCGGEMEVDENGILWYCKTKTCMGAYFGVSEAEGHKGEGA